jgi:hypothetical protein
LGNLVITQTLADHTLRGAGAQGGKFLGHGLGSALAGVKCSQLIESKAKTRAIGTLALLSGGVAKARGIWERKSQHIGLPIYYYYFFSI